VKSPKKTSKVTIILAIILLIIALGCAAVAVILFVLPNNSAVASDAVPAAIEKLIKTGGTRNVEMSGSVNLSGDNTSVDALIDAKYGDGNVVADADISLSTSDLNLAFKLSEITMSKNGVGYVKYDGLYKALEGEVLEKVKDYCNTEEECKEIAAEALKEFNAVSVVDGKWIKIETSDVETFLSDFVPASSFKCLVDTTGEIGDYSDEILSLYKENPFISYSTADINLASKGGQLYQLTIDAEKFTNFVNSMKTVGYANSLRACMGEEATLGDATTSEVAEMLENIPDIFVEIDDNYHFTRVYFNVPSTTSMSAIMVDLSFSYPDIITVSEPTEYVNANDAMKDLFNILYQAS
ncbi:MAG: hypothetical protein Q4A79_02765, partial [Candidatus Saccharibacteria bacterium]|nr:hypothetical protein [Candidatus Saccharibacteria bacterium]